MPTIAENQAAHPNWFVDPETLTPVVKQFLGWQAEQPGQFAATVGDEWALAGTGPLYALNVAQARNALDQRYRGVEACRITCQEPPAAPWETWTPGIATEPTTTGIAASEGGAVFGGE